MPARKTLLQVVQTGDRRASLEALRDELAGSIPDAEPRDKAALSGRLQAVLAELAELPLPTEGSTVGKLTDRAARRRAEAASRKPAATR